MLAGLGATFVDIVLDYSAFLGARNEVMNGIYPPVNKSRPYSVAEVTAQYEKEILKLKAPLLSEESRFQEILSGIEAKSAQWKDRLSVSEALQERAKGLDGTWSLLIKDNVSDTEERISALDGYIARLKFWRKSVLEEINEALPQQLGDLGTQLQILQHVGAGRKLDSETRVLLQEMATEVGERQREVLDSVSSLGGRVESMEATLSIFAEVDSVGILEDAQMYTAMARLETELDSNDLVLTPVRVTA